MQHDIIIVTGSSGLIGSAIAKRFAGDFKVIGFDTKKPKSQIQNFEHFDIDLTSNKSIASALSQVRSKYGEKIASVIHLAAYYDFSGNPDPKYDEITVKGTERLLNSLKTLEVEQFIFSSTMLVHAECAPGLRINEDWPLESKWPYPESKIKTEKLLIKKHGQIPIVLMRIAGVYDDRGHSIPIAHQIHHIYERQLISHFFPGKLTHGQSFVHLNDVVEAFWLCVQKRNQLDKVFPVLIGEPETLSYAQLQRKIGQLLFGEKWKTYRIPTGLAQVGAWIMGKLPMRSEPLIKPKVIPFADDHYALDISRAKSMLGWVPKNSISSTLPKIIAALKADPLKWYQENKVEPPAWLQKKQAAA